MLCMINHLNNPYCLTREGILVIIAVYFLNIRFLLVSRIKVIIDISRAYTYPAGLLGLEGCVIHQPYDLEVGAGTFHPATFLRVLGPEPWSTAYVQPSRRPTDGRYGENPNRMQHYYQFQVILKPIRRMFRALPRQPGTARNQPPEA